MLIKLQLKKLAISLIISTTLLVPKVLDKNITNKWDIKNIKEMVFGNTLYITDNKKLIVLRINEDYSNTVVIYTNVDINSTETRKTLDNLNIDIDSLTEEETDFSIVIGTYENKDLLFIKNFDYVIIIGKREFSENAYTTIYTFDKECTIRFSDDVLKKINYLANTFNSTSKSTIDKQWGIIKELLHKKRELLYNIVKDIDYWNFELVGETIIMDKFNINFISKVYGVYEIRIRELPNKDLLI